LSLVELLAGMAVGLLVIATSFSTLLLSRSAAASISDLSQLQQQGSHALHVIGQQLRQASCTPSEPRLPSPATPRLRSAAQRERVARRTAYRSATREAAGPRAAARRGTGPNTTATAPTSKTRTMTRSAPSFRSTPRDN